MPKGRGKEEIAPVGNAHEIAAQQKKYQKQPAYKVRDDGAKVQDYGQPLYTTAPEAERVDMKLSAMRALKDQGVTTQLSDKDVDYMISIKEQLERAKYNKYLANLYDASSPAERRWFTKLYPEFVQIRKQMIDEEAELQKKIAYLTITGIQTREDAMFWFGLQQSGRMPTGKALYEADAYTSIDSANTYKPGIFAPTYMKKQVQKLQEIAKSLHFPTDGLNGADLTSTPTPQNSTFAQYDEIARAAFGAGGGTGVGLLR